jgi:hypothetical protein
MLNRIAETYMDEARNFHDTDSHGRYDRPLVAKLADQAHTFIFERLAELDIRAKRITPPQWAAGLEDRLFCVLRRQSTRNTESADTLFARLH